MRSAILIVPKADQQTAKMLATSTWPETAQGMFDNAWTDGVDTFYINCMADVSDAVYAQLLEMQTSYVPNARIVLFDIEENAGGAQRILRDLNLSPKE